jgi:hypothetical protein
MVSGRTKGVTDRARGNVFLVAAQRDDGDGNSTEEYLLLRSDEFGRLRLTDETDDVAAAGRTKGATFRVTGDVVLAGSQRDDPDGTPTEQYLLLRADENGRLRTTT